LPPRFGLLAPRRQIVLRDFYVAHLISGQLSATVDGRTKGHLPGDYWAVKAGGGMRVKAVGEVAVLETTVVTKQ
jgi:quercetin dioxygenase-like cupin family protein